MPLPRPKAALPNSAAVLLAVLLAASPAMATPPDGRALLRQGIAQFDQGQLRASLATLERACEALNQPRRLARALLYIGLNQAVMGQRSEADKAFAAALAYDPSLQLDPERFKRSMVQRFGLIKARLRGLLVIRSATPGARVKLDGRAVGRTPLRLALPAGQYRLEVLEGTRQVLAAQASVSPGRTTEVLAPAAPREVLARPRPIAAPAVPSPPRRRIWSWIVAGAALAATAATVGLGVSTHGDRQQYADDLTAWDRAANPTEQQRLEAGLPGLRDQIQTKATATNVLIGVTAALAVGAAVLFVLEGRQPEARVALRPAPGAGLLSVQF